MNIHRDAMSFAFGVIESVGSDPITITREEHSTETTGVISEEDHKDVDAGGMTSIETQTIDWLIAKDNYRIDETPTRPHFGDLIKTADGTNYQVQPPNGMPAWRWSDPHKTYYIVHTIEIERDA